MLQPWSCYPPLSDERYARCMQRAVFDCCKWHLQVEDRHILCRFPLVLTEAAWSHVAELASSLARETLAAESELLQRFDLHDRLGLPKALRGALRRIPKVGLTRADVRVMRFDFHWTDEGWRISEANTDAAGGFIEASGVTRLMAEEYPDCQPTGDPAGVLSQAIHGAIGPAGVVGLMHLTHYSEDRQVMLYLARRLSERGANPCLFGPNQMHWSGGRAYVETDWRRGEMELVIRFFPAEWLPRLPASTGWEHFLAGGRASACNPAHAVVTQSKRFPLVWDDLATPLPTWRALLPATRSPDDLADAEDGAWIFKPALGHEGANVAIPGVTAPADWQSIRREVRRDPAAWTAQRRFQTLAMPTPDGPMYPCLGVYVIHGQVAGAYGRLAHRPLTDDRSREVVVLVPKSAPTAGTEVGEASS